MIYFTKYAEEKFDILNNHKAYIRREEVLAAIEIPDHKGKIGRLLTAERNGVKVIWQKEDETKKIITFYPV